MNNICLNTPIIKIDDLYFKREDQNPSGSIKDRSVIYQLSYARDKGFREGVVSSSGNSAISLAFWSKRFEINITAYLSPKAEISKIEKLKALGAKVVITDKPNSKSFRHAKSKSVYNFRQSTDPQALKGYEELAKEITQQIGKPEAIFFPVSSGTTLLGTGRKLKGTKIFLAQSGFHNPLSSAFDQEKNIDTNNLTKALVAKYIPLKNEINKLVKNSNGGGYTINNDKILIAKHWLKEHKIFTSNEGALALAAAWKAQKENKINTGLVILTGKDYNGQI